MFQIQEYTPSTIESRIVAEQMNKKHKDLLADIRKYSEILAERNFPLGEYFLKSSYFDKNEQERPCYLITEKGCQFLGNKMTGEKGILFTAWYVEKFNQMKDELKEPTVDSRLVSELIENQRLLTRQVAQLIEINRKGLPAPYSIHGAVDVGTYNVMKVDLFPDEIRTMVRQMLSACKPNYSEVSRECARRGYTISIPSIARYHRRMRGV